MKKAFLTVALFMILSCTGQVKEDMKIVSYTGRVKLNTHDVTIRNIVLKRGDAIETNENSTCDIIINKKNIIRLKNDSRLTIKITGKDIVLQLDKGFLAGVIRKDFSGGDRFLIKTPALSGFAENVSFYLAAENEKSTYICICNGSMELNTITGSNETVAAVHHSSRRFTIDKNGALLEDIIPGLLYHSDIEIEQMTEITGDRIEWGKPDAP